MIRMIGAAALLGLTITLPAQQAAAQDPFSVLGGAAAGAVIGGAATGRAGGAVAGAVLGGATGALLSAEAERRRGGYSGGGTAATPAPRAVTFALRAATVTERHSCL